MKPEVVADECQSVAAHSSFRLGLLVLGFNIEQVSLTQEGLLMPEVGVDSVDGDCVISSVNDDSFVEAGLVEAQVVHKRSVLVFALDDLESVAVEHANIGDRVG